MNDSDRQLESRLRRMLDPTVTAPVPPRRQRDRRGKVVAVRAGELVLAAGGLN